MSEKELATTFEKAKALGLITDERPKFASPGDPFNPWMVSTEKNLCQAERYLRLNPDNQELANVVVLLELTLRAIVTAQNKTQELRWL